MASSSISRQRAHARERSGSDFGSISAFGEHGPSAGSAMNCTSDRTALSPATRSTAAGNEHPSANSSMLLGGLALVVCIISFVGQTIITRKVQESYVHPYFILWVSHSFWVIILPLHTVYEKMKRRSRSLAALATTHPTRVLLRTLLLAVLLAGLLNVSAYLWYAALNFSSMSKVTAIYNMSCFFAYFFSILLLKERVQIAKCVAVAISILGVIVMALIDSDSNANVSAKDGAQRSAVRSTELFGDFVSLLCACGIGLYQVLYKKYAVPRNFHSLYHVNFMTAILGLCTFFVYWFPIPILNATRIESFHWPTRAQFSYIVGNALFGVAYNGGFMIALALTSPLFAAIGVMLTIPVMAVVDMIVQGQVLAWNVFAGGSAILIGFAILTCSEYQDTVQKANCQPPIDGPDYTTRDE
ncbi:hypothetical protein GQ54DRAFT_287755 [Martensiomyces pterosporus]|nr:hypothetical protein GQ54DRAFT_287755 [Martensiomyces pterosporus]